MDEQAVPHEIVTEACLLVELNPSGGVQLARCSGPQSGVGERERDLLAKRYFEFSKL